MGSATESAGDSGAEGDSSEPAPLPSTPLLDYQDLMPEGTICDGIHDSSIPIGCALADTSSWLDGRLSFPEDARCIIGDGFRVAMDGELCSRYPTSSYCDDIDPVAVGTACGQDVEHPSQLLALRGVSGSEDAPLALLGNGATLQADDTLTPTSGHGILLIDGVADVSIAALTVDGRREQRPAPKIIENAHNISINSSTDLTFTGVHTLNSPADGYYISGGHEDAAEFSRRVEAYELVVDNSARNNVSIINGADCGIYGGSLTNAVWAGIDLEPDYGSVEPGIVNFTLSGVTVADNGARCVQLSPKGAPTGTVIEGNTISSCRHATNECGTAIIVGHPATITDNTIQDFALSCRGLIDFLGATASAGATFADNTIEDIRHDGSAYQSIFYFHSSNGGGHTVTGNTLDAVSATADAGWCNSYLSDDAITVKDNTIDGTLQQPNPGCSYD
jgi:hypothetical protein